MLLINFYIPDVHSTVGTGVNPFPFFRLFLLNWQNSMYSPFYFKGKKSQIFGFGCYFVTQYFPLPMGDILLCSYFSGLIVHSSVSFLRSCLICLLSSPSFQYPSTPLSQVYIVICFFPDCCF